MPWILPLIIIAVYARSLPIYFSGDDWVFLCRALRGLDLPYIFRFSPGSFAPVINLAFLIFYKLFHLNQIYYHLVILAIHVLNCILLFYIVQEMIQNRKLAFLTAFLFSVFSPYNQIVIWIDGLPGLITSFFFLFSFYNFIIYHRTSKKSHYLLSLSGFIFALLSKEWVITVFALFVFYSILFYRRDVRKILLKPQVVYLPFIIILAIYLSAELLFPYSGKKDMLGPHIFSNLCTYLATFIIPSQNTSEFPVEALIPLLNSLLPISVKLLSVILPILSLIAIIRGSNFIRFFTLWGYITLFPFLFFPWGTASRYYYLPSMGFTAILAYLFFKLNNAAKKRNWKAGLFLCLSVFVIIHIFLIEVRTTKLYQKNKEIQNILKQLQNIYPAFPQHSRLFFSGFSYDRKWGYAICTIYKDPTLIVYRRFPRSEDLERKSFPIFTFDYKNGQLLNKTPLPLSPSSLH